MQALAFLLQQQPATPGLLASPLLMLLVMAAIFYFLVFMPMQKQKKQQAQMLAGLKAGDEVMCTGGILGTIVNVDQDTLVLRVKPDNVKLQVARSAVASLLNADKAVAEKK